MNEEKIILKYFQILWFIDSNSFAEGKITGSKNETLNLIGISVSNCSDISIKFVNAHYRVSYTITVILTLMLL